MASVTGNTCFESRGCHLPRVKTFPPAPHFFFLLLDNLTCDTFTPPVIPMLPSSTSKAAFISTDSCPTSTHGEWPWLPVVSGATCLNLWSPHLPIHMTHVQTFSRVYWQGLQLKSVRESDCPCSIRMVFPNVDGAQDTKKRYVNKGFHGQ